MQKLAGGMRAAIEKYHMIAPGDRIAVGVSGGRIPSLCWPDYARFSAIFHIRLSLSPFR